MPDATLTTKGQVTIPKPVRDHLKLDTGVRVSFVIQDDGVVVLKPVTRHISELAGLLSRPRQRAVSVEAMDDAIARHVRQKFGRR